MCAQYTEGNFSTVFPVHWMCRGELRALRSERVPKYRRLCLRWMMLKREEGSDDGEMMGANVFVWVRMFTFAAGKLRWKI